MLLGGSDRHAEFGHAVHHRLVMGIVGRLDIAEFLGERGLNVGEGGVIMLYGIGSSVVPIGACSASAQLFMDDVCRGEVEF